MPFRGRRVVMLAAFCAAEARGAGDVESISAVRIHNNTSQEITSILLSVANEDRWDVEILALALGPGESLMPGEVVEVSPLSGTWELRFEDAGGEPFMQLGNVTFDAASDIYVSD